MIPHPMKVAKGGEDAFGVSECRQLLSVADGVGGWDRHGIDPAKFSKELVSLINQNYNKPGYKKGNPYDLMLDSSF